MFKIIDTKALQKQLAVLWQKLMGEKWEDVNQAIVASQSAMFFELAKRIDEDIDHALNKMEADFMKAFARIEAQHPPLSFEGKHEAGKQYKRGQFVSFQGHTWHCNRPTKSTPSEGKMWTLAVRRGEDAR